MTQQPTVRRTPLNAEERARSEASFALLVAEHLAASGHFRISADTPELVELFQAVARRVGETLQRPVISYSNGRYMVITFAQEDNTPTLTAEGARTAPR